MKIGSISIPCAIAVPNTTYSKSAIASEISKPCYISFHSAIYLHGLTTQIPRKIQIAVIRRTRKYSILGMEAKEYKLKKGQFNGFYRKEGIMIADANKAFADSLNYPRACPDIVLIEALGSIDLKKLDIRGTAKRRLRRLIKDARKKRT